MWTRSKVKKLADSMGVILMWNDTRHGELTADAPPQTIFACSFTHSLVCEKDDNDSRMAVWQDMGERLSYGLWSCD